MSHRYFRLFFQPCFLVCMFQLLCSLWLAFQVLPGPCNLHRPGGIPRIALGKGGKKKKKTHELNSTRKRMSIACPAQSRMKSISHSIVLIPVPPSWIGICARGSSAILVVRCIANIRESVPLKTVGTVFGLPSTCM